jgi:cytochrome d ubiquinol oxidase subunit II
VFLVSDAHRAGTRDLERSFRNRAIGAGLGTGALAAAGLVALRADAHGIFDKLVSDGLPLVLLSLACGLAVLVLLRRGRRRGSRVLASGAVVAVIWGWAVAQHPYLLPPSLTVSAAAAPDSTLTGVLAVFGVSVLVVLPAIGLLFTLVQRSYVEEDSAPPALE